jgi:hypothetical protein
MSKPDLKLLLGRRIVGAILKKGEGPGRQLFLVLDDGTYTEVYSDWLGVSVGWLGGVDKARAYMASTHKITHEAHLPQAQPGSKGAVASKPAGEASRQPELPTRIPSGMAREALAIWRNDLPSSLKN